MLKVCIEDFFTHFQNDIVSIILLGLKGSEDKRNRIPHSFKVSPSKKLTHYAFVRI